MNRFAALVPALMLAAVLVGCGDEDTAATNADAEAFCEGFGEACMDEASTAECVSTYAECGEEMAVMESCPLQFGC